MPELNKLVGLPVALSRTVLFPTASDTDQTSSRRIPTSEAALNCGCIRTPELGQQIKQLSSKYESSEYEQIFFFIKFVYCLNQI